MTKVKICGITNYEDAFEASRLGADYLGFNFYRKSPRFMEKQKAKKIISKLPRNVKNVGVFVNESAEKIKDTARFCKLDLVQLSGDETPEFVKKLGKTLNKKIIKSLRIKNPDSLNQIKDYKSDYIMLDSYKKEIYGGTGKQFDLGIAKKADSKKLFLAGGLNPSNIAIAIKKINPYAVDVCSGIETYPGKKNFEKMKQFIESVK